MSPKRPGDFYQALFDSTTVRIWHIDRDGRILRANSAVSSDLGLPMEDLVGKRLQDFTSPEEGARVTAENGEVMRSGTPRLGIVEKYSVAGRTGWVRTDKIPYCDASGKIVGLVVLVSEITEHRETEEALRTSQLRLSEAMDLARIVYWEYDPHTDEFILNDPFYAFYGTTAEQEGGYRMSAEEYGARFVHPDDLPRYVQIRQDNPPAGGELLLSLEHRIIRRDGQVRHIVVRIRRVKDGAGELRLYGTNQDITEHEAAEEALRESEARYRSLFDDSPIALIEVDASALRAYIDGLRDSGVEDLGKYADDHPETIRERVPLLEFTRANKAALDLYEAPNMEVYRENARYFIANDAPDSLLKGDFLAIAEGAQAEREQVRVTRSGKRIHISSKWTVLPGYEKTLGRILLCDMDVTKSREAEEALRESEEKFRLLFEKSPDATLLMANGTWIDCNEAALRLTPWLPKDRLASLGPLDFSPEYQPNGRLSKEEEQEHQEILLKEGAVHFEWLTLAPDGREYWHDVSQTIVPIQGKKIVYSVARDITERKRVEEALRESEEKFRLLFEKSPDATLLLANHAFIDCNEAAFRLTPWLTKDQLTKVGPQDFSPEYQPDGRLSKDKQREHDEILEKKGAIRFEWLARAPDGQEFWHDVSQTLVPIQGKKIVHSVTRDITERKRVEEALRESEEKFRLLFEKSPDPTFLFDEDTCIDCNEAGLKLIHWVSKEQLIGSHPSDFSPERQPDGRLSKEKDRERREILLKEGAVNFEWLTRAPDGREFWHDVSQTVVPIQGKKITYSISRDITERKKAAEALRTTRLQLSEAMDLADIVYWEIDPARRVFVFNDAFYAFLGTTAAQEGGYDMAVEEYGGRFVHPGDLGIFQEAVRKIRSGRGPDFVVDLEHRIIRRDGEVRHVLARSRGMRDGSGRITRCYGATQDITKRKEAEEETSRLQSQLLQAQKMEAIGTLAGGVAHDFNNILTVITGFANLAQMSIAKDDRLRPYVDQVIISAERAADLTQSLLAFSRKQNITLAPRDINGLVRSTAKLLGRLLHEDIKLDLQLTDKKVIVEADMTQMDQVLMNLATNARDAMPHGGSLTIRTDVANLDETFERAHGFGKPGTYVHLSVSDTGIGMDERTMARIFEPFFTTKEVGKGTGLGLASVYGVVKQHFGYITVASTPLKGTTFDIYLPIVEMREHAAAAGPEVKGGHETILVVEDDTDVRRLITQALSNQGYTILEAADGDSAIRAFKKHRRAIGLIIIDVVMPGRNGKEVLDEITRTDPGAKAIFMSGYTGDIVLGKGVKEESVDFLQKPLSVPGLLSKVREVLDRQAKRL